MQFLNKICILKVLIYQGKIVKILISFEHVTFGSIFDFYHLYSLGKQACGGKKYKIEVNFNKMRVSPIPP